MLVLCIILQLKGYLTVAKGVPLPMYHGGENNELSEGLFVVIFAPGA